MKKNHPGLMPEVAKVQGGDTPKGCAIRFRERGDTETVCT